ncbi:hypothetical protein GLOIN_2v1480046 [Rhizophagus irregularis DAOM 181602=DAOM 197198]|uniref:Uncharacterized protein n=1 Tax=Rhizophagus irregularis (strain DAOM 181602 / DAOM 197198 / MUCL 43194) TaxID=747089 RepID=A0A2P4PVH3_RHIID|nr:hypothetical protein GLOIN_2v1480046 [Rhizophagus irregularis DAOM 181602=DAOM 197198]POG69399.1 hypothetical protein GLOIN_2v1480046 [Rhizophagus irregularis DAOM 181602=DAOM 197198]|eukprot:XP_025176265.1 hypothetical protein GLOIN_2v1480046 [Rhizophagus irregularis DAOM 181602=DAOM 197198]
MTSDKVLTKKQAERSELLPEETGRRNLVSTEYFDIDVRGFHDSCSSTSDPSSKPNLEEDIESEYYDFRKRHKFFIHGKMQFIKLMPEEILKRIFLLDSISKNNEDTIVHDALHDLIKEMFRDSVLELYDSIKLADFQAGTLDELIKKHGNKIGGTPFSIWICDASIRIYKINYDGIYRFLVANVVIPTEQAQFIEALKHRISEVLTVIASNTPSRSTYGRMPTSSPKLIKVTITGLQPN